MRMDKLTSRFQQAIADAQSLAVGRDHNVIEPVHLLVALLDQQGGGTRPLLAQSGVNVPALRERDPQRAVERMSLMAQGTGGGTRIGESLATFNRWHAKRCIHSRTCVMIVSDGYDTGPAESLGEEMRALRRRCKRIAWLNPMIGWQDYAPEAAGMKAALPYIDLFAPAHNLQSLEALEPYLARS